MNNKSVLQILHCCSVFKAPTICNNTGSNKTFKRKLCASFLFLFLFLFIFTFYFIFFNNNFLKVEVLSVNFTPEDPGELIGGNRFKSVDQYLLPKV